MALDDFELSSDIGDIAQESIAEESTSDYSSNSYYIPSPPDKLSHSAVSDGLSRWKNYVPPFAKSSAPTNPVSPQWGRIGTSASRPVWGRIASTPKPTPASNHKLNTEAYKGVPKDDMFGSNIEDTFLKLSKSKANHALGRNKG